MSSSILAILALASALAEPPASPDPRPVPIRGVVVDHPGHPVAGADVWLADAIPADEGRRFGLEFWWSALTGPGEGTPPILIHGRTGADGAFAIELPAEAVARRSPPELAVWAAVGKGGEARVASRRMPRVVLADDPPVRIALGPPAHAELIVLAPGRKPAGGARVVPSRVGEVLVPEPIGRLLAAVADASGRVVIPGLDASAAGEVRVEAAGFGVQWARIPDPGMTRDEARAAVVELAPVGRIVGRLVAPRGEPIRGVSVRATSRVGGYDGSGQGGTARADCDKQGRFEIPAIAAGMVSLELEIDPVKGPRLGGESPRGLVVRAGQATEVMIPLRETVTFRGLVREKGTKRPIAGVKVALNGYTGGDRFAVTGADGRFAGRIPRDMIQPYGWPIRLPSPFYWPADDARIPQRMPGRDAIEMELPPREMARGVDVGGTIRGEDGRPVAGARIEAIWFGAQSGVQASMARTGPSGGFVLHGVDPLAELNLTARDGFAATAPVSVRASSVADHPIALTLRPKDAVPIAGRVVDPDGRPIAGAAVRIRRRARNPEGRLVVDELVADGDGSAVLSTDADGRFRTRARYPSCGAYHAVATAPGRLAARSPAIAPDRPVEVVLPRVGAITGRVVDRRGRPVAGAVVRQSGDGPMPTEATAGADGRFHLPGVVEGPALVVAEKAGFRPSLRPIDDRSKSVEILMAHRDEPPIAAYRTLPSARPVEEEVTLARGLIAPLAEAILSRGDDPAKYRFLVDAAAVDPPSTIDWLDRAKFRDPEYADAVRQELATALARESLDEATSIVEAGTGGYARASGYVGLFDTAPNATPDRRRALLDQALLHSKAATPPLYRFLVVGQIADRLIDLGDIERARAVLREAQELIAHIPRKDEGSELCPLYIAVALSRIDRPAGLKVVADYEEAERKAGKEDRSPLWDRFTIRIAHAMADRSPAEAERLLEHVTGRPHLDREVVAVCHRMAPKDAARARRIAAGRISAGSSTFRPYALGLMAQAVAVADRAEAVRLLDDAFADLARLAPGETEDRWPRAADVAGALLPVVEQVAPDRLGEFLGRAVLLRCPRGDQSLLDGTAPIQALAHLSMLVARYDRALADRILRPALDQVGRIEGPYGRDSVTPDVLAALALIDPRRAVAMVESLPEDPPPGTDPYATRSQSRRSVARVLGLHGDERWRTIFQQMLYLWTPDQKFQ